MSEIAIRVENLSKLYHIGAAQKRHDTLRDAIADFRLQIADFVSNGRSRNGNHNSEDTIWALKDISFEVKRGEVVGVIGRNGAGKSTLLKILSRITEPTNGRAIIDGRVGSLLEVGTGFHPELTGRENIYLNGAILGMKRVEIERKFDEIVAFAEIEKFLDTPVKHYSSGMYVRLAFAVAAHLEPEILLVDEVLAVGDAAFQKKCLGKMGDVAKEGRTVLFVSHSMDSILNLCKSGLLIAGGEAFFRARVEDAVRQYMGSLTKPRNGLVELSHHEGRANGMVPIARSIGLRVRDSDRDYCTMVNTGDDLVFEIHYDCGEKAIDLVQLGVSALGGGRVFTVGTHMTPGFEQTLSGKGTIECSIPHLPLGTGDYGVTLMMGRRVPPHNVDCIENALTFRVECGDYFSTGVAPLPAQGYLVQRANWTVESQA